MPSLRTFPVALAAFAAAIALVPAATQAALPDPVWQDPQTVAPTEAGAAGVGVLGDMTPVGGAFVGWPVNDGTLGIRISFRPPGGTWSEPFDLTQDGYTTYAPYWVAAADGTITFIYALQENGSVYTRTLSPAGELSEPVLMGNGACGHVAMAPDGTTYAVWCQTETYMRVRPAGSSEWGPVEQVSEPHTSSSTIALAPNGDQVLLYSMTSPGRLRARIRRSGETAWTNPVTVSAGSPDVIGDPVIRHAFDGDGRLVAFWKQEASSVPTGHAAIMDLDTGSWSTPVQLGGNGTVTGTAIADGDGNVASSWIVFDGMSFAPFGANLQRGSGSWSSSFSLVPSGQLGGVTGIARRADGTIWASVLHGPSMMSVGLGAISRNTTTGVWGAPDDLDADSIDVMSGGAFGTDAQGNLMVAWKTADGTPMVIGGDGAGPALVDLTVPGSLEKGSPVSVSVSAVDAWSEVASISWDFGDGTSKSGSSASHAYASSGTYTVTVTATDSLGHSTSESRAVTVTLPPSPPSPPSPPAEESDEPDEEPVVLPPVLEARLSGKTITVNARVALKARKRCTGNAGATTAFGGRSYRTTLKLKTVDGKCRATGTIKLKKTPSLRSKLRITISGKQIKTRTLTTKRG